MLFMGSSLASATPEKPVMKNDRQHLLGHGHRMILIDAGHGGIDGGTSYGNILEKISP